MCNKLASTYARQRLLFFISEDVDDRIRAKIQGFVADLAALRIWVLGAPCFVHSTEAPADKSRGDLDVETIGGYLEIYSALPPNSLPAELDRQHFEEATALVDALCELSRSESLAIDLELDDTFVGSIKDGERDRLLSEGFIGEWKRHLGV
jgi:hypothetical protein